MKTKFFLPLFFSAGFFVQQNSFAQIIPNSGFENWATGGSGYLEPVGWITNNTSLDSARVVQAQGRSGDYCVNFLSIYGGSGGPYGGSIEFNFGGSMRPILLSGYWKTNFVTASNGISANLYVFDSTLTPFGWASVGTFASLSNWTEFSDSISYVSQATAYSFKIVIGIYSTSPTSIGYVDDLDLTYITSTNEIQTTHLLNSYISSDLENHSLHLNLPFPQSFTTTIFSADGKKVSQKNYSLSGGQHQISLSTENLSQGIYFCRVVGEGVNKSFKFIK